MKQRTLQILYAYWDGLRAGRLAPLRLEIDPAQLGTILPEIFLLERTDATTYCYRLAGTRLCEMFGTELRGSNFLDGWSAADRAVLAGDLKLTCEEGAGTLLTVESCADSVRRIELEGILLPLMHADATAGRVIGAMSPMTSPHWLGHDHLVEKRILRHELIWPNGRQRSEGAAGGAGPMFAPATVATKGDRRAFRVLEGGRKED